MRMKDDYYIFILRNGIIRYRATVRIDANDELLTCKSFRL